MTVSASAAIARLEEGNLRFVEGRHSGANRDAARRASLATGQAPFAVVLACADSRVVPELAFDQGLGDLFSICVAGNIVDDAILGSIEYAVHHLDVQLVVVLGHQSCGAVGAAVAGQPMHDHIDSLIDAIAPAVDRARAADPDDLLDAAVRENARMVADALRTSDPRIAPAVDAGARVVAAYYDLHTGEVSFLDG